MNKVFTATASQKTPDDTAEAVYQAAIREWNYGEPQAEHSPLPSKWHDCDIAEKQIKQLQHERDEARQHAEALAEALRLCKSYAHGFEEYDIACQALANWEKSNE